MVLQDVPPVQAEPVLQGERKEWLDQSPGTTGEGQGHTAQDRKGGKDWPGRSLPGPPVGRTPVEVSGLPGLSLGARAEGPAQPKAPTQGSRWIQCENWFLSVHFPADRAQDTGYGVAWSMGISPQQLHSTEHCPKPAPRPGCLCRDPGPASGATPSSPGWGFAWHRPLRDDLQQCPCDLFLRAPLYSSQPQQRALN